MSTRLSLGLLSGMKVGEGDAALVAQLCVQVGFPRDVEDGEYLSGQRSELYDDFPEAAWLRDVAFLTKLLLVPALEALPEPAAWRPSHARLDWKVLPPTLRIKARFGNELRARQGSEGLGSATT